MATTNRFTNGMRVVARVRHQIQSVIGTVTEAREADFWVTWDFPIRTSKRHDVTESTGAWFLQQDGTHVSGGATGRYPDFIVAPLATGCEPVAREPGVMYLDLRALLGYGWNVSIESAKDGFQYITLLDPHGRGTTWFLPGGVADFRQPPEKPSTSAAAPAPSEGLDTTVAARLRRAADLYGERRAVYGPSERRFGLLMAEMFPSGLTLHDPRDWMRMGVFVQIMNKLCRYTADFARPHADSTRDLSVYGAMLADLDAEFKGADDPEPRP